MLTRLRKLITSAVILSTVPALSLTTAVYGATAPVVTVLKPVTENVSSPLRLVFDGQGNYYVTDPRRGGVSTFNSSGQLTGVLKTPAPPQGIALNDRGNLLVSQGDSVIILDQSGTEVGRLGSGAGQFRKADGIAIDAAGYVYVVDTLDSKVKVFTAAGQFVQAIGSQGTGLGQFSQPTGIAYEKSANQIAVADTQNGRVEFFDASGNHDFVKSIGSFGIKPLEFKSPVGITFDYDAAGGLNRMYVVDTYQNAVQVIDPSGAGGFLATIGSDGLANGQLMIPLDVAFDRFNRRLAVVNGYGYLTMYGIDGTVNASNGGSSLLGLDPVPARVAKPYVTISGTVGSRARVVVTTNTTAVAASVVYTSATTWKCSVSGLVAGNNVLTVIATDSTGNVAKHAVSVTYAP